MVCSSSCPRIVIAGTHSGVGKTSVSIAMTALFKKHGLRVQTFKVGPDFLDPTYLAAASGRPCYNLDTWMFGKEYTKELFVKTTEDADIAIIEGVMGFYDGADPVLPDGSTFEVANILQAPVIIVADAKGVSRSFAAMVKGYVEFDKFKCAGVIANNCGSERHVDLLRESISACSLPPFLGGITKGSFGQLRSRHLGLVSAEWEKKEVFSCMADALEKHIPFEKIMANLNDSQTLSIETEPQITKPSYLRLGLAYDEAFHFYYNDNIMALERMGCEIVRFSPVNDDSLPSNLDGLYIGGGYPEEHVKALSENRGMIKDIQDFAARGGLVYAECGGLLYLTRSLKTIDDKKHPMVGLLPVESKMRKRFKSLGYVEVEFGKDSLFGRCGEKIRGHTFHYSELESDPTQDTDWIKTYSLKRRRTKENEKEGFRKGRVLATYVHAHFASKKEVVHNFINSCKEKQ